MEGKLPKYTQDAEKIKNMQKGGNQSSSSLISKVLITLFTKGDINEE